MIFMPLFSIILSIQSDNIENGDELNDNCNNERNKMMSKKKADNHIHRCCNEILICTLFE
ncbi:hypothetical protein BLA29_011252 [Euroglyphus maynei]|uniref:Uncharacterized protein n=1 Tax=Euroglyphus maynei TaxID=6958 RepID=A0A1Y3BRI3_EURMA|nr:hypothetical protein BLA29_011252 [Euroglyphus maynei]